MCSPESNAAKLQDHTTSPSTVLNMKPKAPREGAGARIAQPLKMIDLIVLVFIVPNFPGGTVGKIDGSDPGADRDGDGRPAALVRPNTAGRYESEAGRRPPGPAVQGVLAAGGHEDRAGARAQPAAGRPDGQAATAGMVARWL